MIDLVHLGLHKLGNPSGSGLSRLSQFYYNIQHKNIIKVLKHYFERFVITLRMTLYVKLVWLVSMSESLYKTGSFMMKILTKANNSYSGKNITLN